MGGFGFPFGNMQRQQQQKENCITEVKVTLEDIYNENTVTVNYRQKNYCKKCNGNGTKNGKSSECPECNGRGQKVVISQRGNMIHQMIVQCDKCNGRGSYINPSDRCSVCNGNKFNIKNKTLDIPLKRGLSEGNKIHLRNKGHHLKDGRTDLIIIVKEHEHNVFTRNDSDLHMKMNIKLYQALFGFNKIINHLDKRKLHLQYNETVKGNILLLIKNEGMYDLNNRKGDLYVHIETDYPDLSKLEENEKALLKKILVKTELDEYYKENKIVKISNKEKSTLEKVSFKKVSNKQRTNNERHDNEQPNCVQQ